MSGEAKQFTEEQVGEAYKMLTDIDDVSTDCTISLSTTGTEVSTVLNLVHEMQDRVNRLAQYLEDIQNG